MVLSPRQAVQQVNDKLEEWWGRFVTPDLRRQRDAAAMGDDDDDDDNVHEDGDDDDDDPGPAAGGGRRRLSLLVNKLFQDARRFPQFVHFPQLPPLPQMHPQQLLGKLLSSAREQLGVYLTQVGAQIDRLPPLPRVPTLPSLPAMEDLKEMLPRLPQLPAMENLKEMLPQLPAIQDLRERLPQLPQLPAITMEDLKERLPQLPAVTMEDLKERLPQLPATMEDVKQMASNCWEAVEKSYDENKVVYKRRLTWGSVILFYLLAMLLCTSQCCQTPPTISTGNVVASSAVEVVYNPLQQEQQQKRRGNRTQHQQEGGEQHEKPAGAARTLSSWLLSTTSIPAVDKSFGKTRDVDKKHNTTSSSSSSVSTKVRHLDGACASTSLSASSKCNMENVIMGDQQQPPPPPPPLWFTFVRANQANTKPTLPPIALRMVKDVDGYYVDDDDKEHEGFENRTILPPPNSTTIKTTSASFLKSMDVAGVNIAMEEEKEKEAKKNGILYPAAFTPQPVLRKQDVGFLHAWSRRITAEIADINERSLRVSWGGGQHHDDDSSLWWQERHSSRILLGRRKTSYFSWWKCYSSSSISSSAAAAVAAKDPLQDIDGGHLLYSYYQVLLPQFMKDPSKVTFPRHHANLCPENGCSTQLAIRHTLEFRESYQPWRSTASMVKENEQGWIYARGLAKAAATAGSAAAASTKEESTTTTTTTTNNSATMYGQHAMIWARPGQHSIKDPQAYNRAILQTLEQAIATSLDHSHGQVGRFNVVIDAAGFEWSKLPDLAVMKQLLHVLQDHYPRRLGAIFMFNLPPSAFVFLTFILKTYIDREVRRKIYLLSRNPVQRLAQLESVVDIKDIPVWIQGGQDSYEFDANTYYSSPKTWLDDDFDKKETK